MPAGPVPVTGTASIGKGTDLSDTAIVYVLDVSASTRSPDGCGDNPNNDDVSNTVLDCEIAAVEALNQQAVGNGRLTEVGAAVFGEVAVTADVGPASGEQLITGPASDADKAGGRDIDQVLTSVFSTVDGEGGVGRFTSKGVGGNTNFADGIQKATMVAGASGKAHKIVAFLSDGFATAGGSITESLANVPPNVDIYTFAVGDFSSCDNTGFGQGSLQQISNATGGTCTPVTDAAALPDILAGVITTELTSLTLQVDGGAVIPITQVTPALPHAGPVKVNYTAAIPALAPGQHTVCVTANGHEGGRAVSATDCHIITARQAALAVDPLIGPPGLVVRAVGTDFPPGARIRLAWSVGLSETPGEVIAGSDGRFDAQVLIFHKDRVGLRELTAVPVAGPPFATVTSQPFLVVPRTLQPPFFEGNRLSRR
jgi:trimeric autotransporter adhesin